MITLNNKHNVIIIKLNKHKKISSYNKSNYYLYHYLLKYNKTSLKELKHEIIFIIIMLKDKTIFIA